MAKTANLKELTYEDKRKLQDEMMKAQDFSDLSDWAMKLVKKANPDA